jgi:uncharacterized protein
MQQQINFNIKGLHCQGCKHTIETELSAMDGVSGIKVDYSSGKAEAVYDSEKISKEKIFNAVTALNYTPEDCDPHANDDIVVKNGSGNKVKSAFKVAVLFAVLAILIAGYYLLGLTGIFSIFARLSEHNLGYGLIFAIGLLAGFHCVGMCGGIVASFSANSENKAIEKKKRIMPQIQYNAGRLLSYSAVGAILGGLGSIAQPSAALRGAIMVFAAVFMFLVGLRQAFGIRLGDKFFSFTSSLGGGAVFRARNALKGNGPLAIGLVTGLLPCGPLQAMQIYALGTGNATAGALSMAVYALGTMPVLFSFGTVISSLSREKSGKIAAASGYLVLILAAMMLYRGVGNLNILGGTTSANTNIAGANEKNTKEDESVQIINMDLTYDGYQPNVLKIKEGVKVRWVINAREISGCTREIILHDYNIRKSLVRGENIIEFMPREKGEIKFSCGMQMVWGKFIVI